MKNKGDLKMSLGTIFSLNSECCEATINLSCEGGVQIGTCSGCEKIVIRVNPIMPQSVGWEWLDGNPPATSKKLRPVSQ